MNTTHKLLFGLLSLSIVYCSKPEMEQAPQRQVQQPETPTPAPTPDATDTLTAWSEWAPAFSDQKEGFTQTRTRAIQVNGNADATPPAGALSETREIVVSVSQDVFEETERVFGHDIGNDGDDVDLLTRITNTYTASEGLGSFSGESSYVLLEDIPFNFWTNNRGVWAGGLLLDDVYQNLDIAFIVNKHGLVASFNRIGAEGCFTNLPATEGGIIEYVGENNDEDNWNVTTSYPAQEYADLIGQDDVDLLAEYGVTRIQVALSLSVLDTPEQSFVVFGENIYAIFNDGSVHNFLIWGGNLGLYETLDTCSQGSVSAKKSNKYANVKVNKLKL